MAKDRFNCTLAIGAEDKLFSSEWIVWSARKQPDLYLGIVGLSDLKATIHCPRPSRPNWWRRYSFDSNAKGEIAHKVTAKKSRHILSWRGRDLGQGFTQEWSVHVSGRSLQKNPKPAGPNTYLLPIPDAQHIVQVTAFLGPAEAPDGLFPREAQRETHLIKQGRLTNGAHVSVVWCMVEIDKTSEKPQTLKVEPEQGEMVSDFESSVVGSGDTRALLYGEQADGHLAFWERRAEWAGKSGPTD